jgi:putative transport protein
VGIAGTYMLAMVLGMRLGMNSVTGGLAILSLAVTFGLALGAIRIRGLRLGISGVLFSALVFGQLGFSVEPKVLEFLRDFALIIFIYALGLQVGPGFVSSLRDEGLRLNLLSLIVIVLGALLTAIIIRSTLLPKAFTPGLYAGAFTTTPGLAAGQEALRRIAGAGSDAPVRAGLAYTVTYPFGVIGPILVIAALKRIFRIRMSDELAKLGAAEEVRRPPITSMDFELTQESHAGGTLRQSDMLRSKGILFSRLIRDGAIMVPTGDTEMRIGDVYRAVGSRTALAEVVEAMGRQVTTDMTAIHGELRRQDLIVTRTQVARRTLRELDLIRRTGVTIVRINRAGVELAPKASFRLQFGDIATVVGPEAGLKMAEAELGNCPDTLNRPQLVPIFLGIVLGVMVGSIPLWIPGLHTTLRIGLAGGPLLAALALSQLGSIGSVVWYMPAAANSLFRDFGLAVFLACVGLQAGDHFAENLVKNGGVELVLWGALLTLLPVFAVGVIARKCLKMNFVTLSGWVAGAMTSMPALMFANDMIGSDAPATVYAAVAPLGLLVPIICTQLLVVWLS